MTLGQLADKLITVRTDRLGMQSHVDSLKSQQVELEVVAIRELAKAHLQKASGLEATISSNQKDFAIVDDWDKFSKWIMKKKDLAVLNRALNQKHILDLRADKKTPDGLRFESMNRLSITKLG